MSGVGCRVSGVGCRVSGVGCRVSGVGCRVSGVGRRVSGVGCRVSVRLTSSESSFERTLVKNLKKKLTASVCRYASAPPGGPSGGCSSSVRRRAVEPIRLCSHLLQPIIFELYREGEDVFIWPVLGVVQNCQHLWKRTEGTLGDRVLSR